MKYLFTSTLMILLLVSSSFAQGKIGLQIGYWSPGLDEFNDGLGLGFVSWEIASGGDRFALN